MWLRLALSGRVWAGIAIEEWSSRPRPPPFPSSLVAQAASKPYLTFLTSDCCSVVTVNTSNTVQLPTLNSSSVPAARSRTYVVPLSPASACRVCRVSLPPAGFLPEKSHVYTSDSGAAQPLRKHLLPSTPAHRLPLRSNALNQRRARCRALTLSPPRRRPPRRHGVRRASWRLAAPRRARRGGRARRRPASARAARPPGP